MIACRYLRGLRRKSGFGFNIIIVLLIIIAHQNMVTIRSIRASKGKDSLQRLLHPLKYNNGNISGQNGNIISILFDVYKNTFLNDLRTKIYPDLNNCSNKQPVRKYVQNGNFWVLQNYIPATVLFKCNETITYSTHGEFDFLDNIIYVTKRWQGPVSFAVYAPGTDFEKALKTIFNIRSCVSAEVKKYVSFHLFFDSEHFPEKIPKHEDLFQYEKDICKENLTNLLNATSYRHEKNLFYPVNVARTIARANTATYFIFASDVELYPSPNVITDFFQMLKNPDVSGAKNKRVYVFPVFEIEKDQLPPENKSQLIQMLDKRQAILFHERFCKQCHMIPNYYDWKKAKVTPGLSVFTIGKRQAEHKVWEPFYIGTREEPVFDVRLTSEGRGNKMTQAYAMCLTDYDYHVLDNAFLVHRPGIKKPGRQFLRNDVVIKQDKLILTKIVNEYHRLYGLRKECQVKGYQIADIYGSKWW